jgi:hypothetical protein
MITTGSRHSKQNLEGCALKCCKILAAGALERDKTSRDLLGETLMEFPAVLIM